ncbi:hypothetical protein [Dactylosporangium fulvum]|uniref:Uncharacterized protein n=1 Tax=Dactylosporangium fulvum TaxID=53359 RepID=A0ABY5VYI1_9ACTN|nr:hypothetical protein [Dactylosporangium fulvum]UWP80816.1 hypothetical protein Dfulv_37620 [Dactylosporangium fulvum]
MGRIQLGGDRGGRAVGCRLDCGLSGVRLDDEVAVVTAAVAQLMAVRHELALQRGEA